MEPDEGADRQDTEGDRPRWEADEPDADKDTEAPQEAERPRWE
jgi:hypothetical protein